MTTHTLLPDLKGRQIHKPAESENQVVCRHHHGKSKELRCGQWGVIPQETRQDKQVIHTTPIYNLYTYYTYIQSIYNHITPHISHIIHQASHITDQAQTIDGSSNLSS